LYHGVWGTPEEKVEFEKRYERGSQCHRDACVCRSWRKTEETVYAKALGWAGPWDVCRLESEISWLGSVSGGALETWYSAWDVAKLNSG
jgi:hypothetical protein